jgi:hypothetical protein
MGCDEEFLITRTFGTTILISGMTGISIRGVEMLIAGMLGIAIVGITT